MNRPPERLTPEMLAKIRGAKNAVTGLSARVIRCPYCRHRMTDVYAGTKGFIKEKCTGCGRESVVDLLSWRRQTVSFSIC
jgi:DNA-directed RNA polymerase subunit RPC12/RpoP